MVCYTVFSHLISKYFTLMFCCTQRIQGKIQHVVSTLDFHKGATTSVRLWERTCLFDRCGRWGQMRRGACCGWWRRRRCSMGGQRKPCWDVSLATMGLPRARAKARRGQTHTHTHFSWVQVYMSFYYLFTLNAIVPHTCAHINSKLIQHMASILLECF